MNMIVCKWNKLTVCQSQRYTKKMQGVLQDPDTSINKSCTILKNDPTSTVVVVQVDNQSLVIKRANTKGLLHFMRRLVCTSRAQKNWYYAARLARANIRTFEPIAYIEERLGPLKRRSYFICSLIEGIDALHFFSAARYQAKWEIVAEKIVLLIKKLAEEHLSHRDLNLSNIILVDDQPFLIDLDSMREYRFSLRAKRATVHEVNRFMENWQDYPDISPQVAQLFTHHFQAKGLLK